MGRGDALGGRATRICSGAVKLITLHRILIATMIAFLGYFAWWQSRLWQRDGSRIALAMVIGSGIAAAALTWYLTHLRRFVRVGRRDGEEAT